MLTEWEYKELQDSFTKKLKKDGSKASQNYNAGILACKSILSKEYKRNINIELKNTRTGKINGIKFTKQYKFVIKPKNSMQHVYQKIVPEFRLKIVNLFSK